MTYLPTFKLMPICLLGSTTVYKLVGYILLGVWIRSRQLMAQSYPDAASTVSNKPAWDHGMMER